jgi:hypothetical protein
MGSYAVEASVRVDGIATPCVEGRFGLALDLAEGGSWAGRVFHASCSQSEGLAQLWEGGHADGSAFAEAPFPADDAWHTLRFEVDGNSIRFLIDDVLVGESTDSRLPSAYLVTLYSNQIEISVRSFRVIAL